jgi:hypothetical protein
VIDEQTKYLRHSDLRVIDGQTEYLRTIHFRVNDRQTKNLQTNNNKSVLIEIVVLICYISYISKH